MDAGKVAIDAVWSALQTAATWLQTAWDKSDTLRALLAGAAKLAFDGIKIAIDSTWTAVETLADWMQTLWNKTDTIRSLISGGFKLALDAAGTAFGVLSDIVMGVYNALVATWDLMQKVLGPDLSSGVGFVVPKGKVASGAVGTTPSGGPVKYSHSGERIGTMSFSNLQPDEVARILRRDETVLTNDQLGAVMGGGGGNVYNVTVQAGPTSDLVSIGAAVIEAITAAERSQGAGWRTAVGVG
jgi:hypothetical protein